MKSEIKTTKTINALSFLSDLEKDSLSQFVQNETMKEALKKVLTDQILNMGVNRAGEPSLFSRNWVFGIDPKLAMTDEEFGRAVRVQTEALILIEQGMSRLNELLPDTTDKEPKKNPAL